MIAEAAACLGAYALGTFPTGILVGKRTGHDEPGEGSGNPGASNVYRVAGFRAGAIVLIGDLVKGMASAGVGYAIGGRVVALVVGGAAVIGHCFPIQRWGRGGKGVATAGGVGVVVFPALIVVLAALWFLIARVLNKASLGSLVVVVAAPAVVLAIGRPAHEIELLTAVCFLVLARHHSNIRRLLRGEESSLRSGV